MEVVVRVVPVDRIWDLRHRILRTDLPPETAKFPGDEKDESLHLGAFAGERLVGCATLHLETYQNRPAWRLRGMAVEADARGLDVGQKLLVAIDRHVQASPVRSLWCNARLPAVGFYERCGWDTVSGIYDIPTAGPHRTMIRRFEFSAPAPNVHPANRNNTMPIRVTIWHEYRHEKKHEAVAKLYPEGMHGQLAKHLKKQDGIEVTLAALDDTEHGLPASVIDSTDVMLWWGHGYHHEVADEVVDRVHKRVLGGMGLIVLHSGHYSKIFRKLMGTTCDLKWRVAKDREILWVTKPGHPILAGIEDHFVLEQEEMYGEYFDVPEPDETLLISTFSGGECFRSGLTWQRGTGKIFYFRPGHETYPSYYDANVLRVITNAVRWATPVDGGKVPTGCVHKPEPGWA